MRQTAELAITDYDKVKEKIDGFSEREMDDFLNETINILSQEETIKKHGEENVVVQVEKLFRDLKDEDAMVYLQKLMGYDHLNELLGDSDSVYDKILTYERNLAIGEFGHAVMVSEEEINEIVKKYDLSVLEYNKITSGVSFYLKINVNYPTKPIVGSLEIKDETCQISVLPTKKKWKYKYEEVMKEIEKDLSEVATNKLKINKKYRTKAVLGVCKVEILK